MFIKSNSPYTMYGKKIILARKEEGLTLFEYVSHNIQGILNIIYKVFEYEYSLIKIDDVLYFYDMPKKKPEIMKDDAYEDLTARYNEGDCLAFTKYHDIYILMDRIMLVSKIAKALNIDGYANPTSQFKDYSLREVFIHELARCFFHEAFHIHQAYVCPTTDCYKMSRVIRVKGYSKISEDYAESNAIKLLDKYFYTILRKVRKLEGDANAR